MLDIVARFTHILTMLQNAVAGFLAAEARGPYAVWLGGQLYVEKTRPSPHRKIATEIWVLLTHRAERLARRFQRLVEHWRAGTLLPPRPARASFARSRQAGARPTAAEPPGARLRLPREHGWVNKRIGAHAQCAGLLHYLLQDPALPRFLAEVPRAGRLLRPICHALGLTPPDWLRLPVRPRAKKIAAPPAKPEAGTAPPPTPFRPLQPYVRAAARAWKKFDG